MVRALFDAPDADHVFDRAILIADANHNFDVFGYYGLSLWLVSDTWTLERVLDTKTRKARRVALFNAGALSAQGLSLVPSGKLPHYDASLGPAYGVCTSVQASADSARELVDRFITATYTVETNPFYAQDPS